MSLASKREYLECVRGRYLRGGKRHKTLILDELCRVFGCARKHGIRLFSSKRTRQKRPGPVPEYGPEVLGVLKKIWLLSDQLCSKRLKAAMPLWLQFESDLTEELEAKLLAISPAQIDRLLKPVRANYPGLRRHLTRPGSLISRQIPVRCGNEDITEPGYLEVDTVAHGGETCSGDYIWTVTFTDIHTGWTEVRANWNRTAAGILEKVKALEAELPFEIKGFDSDNGGEFINYALYEYLSKKRVKFTRSRPYKKNDNAHVEQKNWTHVRQLLGNERLEQPELVELINDLCRNEWRRYQNFFRPSFKLKRKIRVGGKVRKEYETPETPYSRVMRSQGVTQEAKEKLRKEFESCNPHELKRLVEKKLKKIFTLNRQLATRGRDAVTTAGTQAPSSCRLRCACAALRLHSSGSCLKQGGTNQQRQKRKTNQNNFGNMGYESTTPALKHRFGNILP